MIVSSAYATARVRVVVILLVAFATACGDFPRTNPYDPNAELDLALAGPDSVDAAGDTVTFALSAAHGVTLSSATWVVTNDLLTPLSTPGQYRVNAGAGISNVFEGPITVVTARVGVHSATKTFRLRQRAAGLAARGCDGATTILFTSLRNQTNYPNPGRAACVSFVDRRGFAIPASQSPTVPITLTIRDPAIAVVTSLQNMLFDAVGVGSTYAVYTSGTFRDSVRITVKQAPAYVFVDPAACNSPWALVLKVGDTLQVKGSSSIADERGNPITDPATIQSTIDGMIWYQLWDSHGILNITPGGFVTALGPGATVVGADFPGSRSPAYCFISVE